MKRALLASFLLALATMPADASQADCAARLEQAEGAGFIKHLKPVREGLEVTVAEDIWKSLSPASKAGMIRNLNCALRKHGKVFARIRVRSDLTGGIVAEASGNSLVSP